MAARRLTSVHTAQEGAAPKVTGDSGGQAQAGTARSDETLVGMLLSSALVLPPLIPTQKLERHREPGGGGALRTRPLPWPRLTQSHRRAHTAHRVFPLGCRQPELTACGLPWSLCSIHAGLLAPSNTPGSLQLGHLRLRPPRLLVTLPLTSFGVLRSVTCRHNLLCSCSLKTANPSASRENPLAFSALFSRRHLPSLGELYVLRIYSAQGVGTRAGKESNGRGCLGHCFVFQLQGPHLTPHLPLGRGLLILPWA